MGLKANNGPLIVIRADASTSIGSGHIMRCLTLAAELASRNAKVVFVTNELPTYLRERIHSGGYLHFVIPVQLEVHRERADAEATLSAIEGQGDTPKWIVVDHYRLAATWQRAVSAAGSRVMVIDDLADRQHDAHVLLDQNLVANTETRYSGLVAESTLQLLGLRYAMLQPDYRIARGAIARGRAPRRALVYFGAADQMLTSMVVEAYLRNATPNTALDVVLDTKNTQFEALTLSTSANRGITLHKPIHTLAYLMANADLFVGAGGTTSWERLCLGLPSIVVTMADNQLPIAAELERRGFVDWLGRSNDITVDQLADGLACAFAEPCPVERIHAMMHLVDGFGIARVCDVLHLGQEPALQCRNVAENDSDLVLKWANDPGTRRFALQQHEIQPAEHSTWFAKRLNNPAVAFFIVETPSGTPVGLVRFERGEDGTWTISYLVAPLFRSQGLGLPLLKAGLDALASRCETAIVMGFVKAENIASARIFRALDFVAVNHDQDGLLFRRLAKQH